MERTSDPEHEVLPHRGDEPHLLREVFRTYQALMSGLSRQTGMPAARFALLRQLALAEAAVGVTGLARRLEIDPAAVTRQVQELARAGLVRRRADPRDARRRLVELTPKGRKLFAAIHERHHELERALATELGEREMRQAAELLVRLRAWIDGQAAEPGEGRR